MDFKRNFYKATRNANSSRLVFPYCCWTLSHATGLSDLRCRLPTATLRLPSSTLHSGFLLPAPWLAFPCLLPVASRSRAQVFVWFRTKTDKGIVCLADHPHSVTACLLIFSVLLSTLLGWGTTFVFSSLVLSFLHTLVSFFGLDSTIVYLFIFFIFLFLFFLFLELMFLLFILRSLPSTWNNSHLK